MLDGWTVRLGAEIHSKRFGSPFRKLLKRGALERHLGYSKPCSVPSGASHRRQVVSVTDCRTPLGRVLLARNGM